MNNRWARLIGLLAFILLTLVSCGQKGDLYLPDEKRTFSEIPRLS
jgi:predicted small lipoprotein YifL